MRKIKLFLLTVAMIFATITFAQREVGQIIASDPEGDEFYFTLMEQSPTDALNVTPDGMLYISNEDELNKGIHTAYIRVKEIYTTELYEAYATMTVFVTDSTSLGGIECDTTIWWKIDSTSYFEWEYTDSIPVSYDYTDSTEIEIITIDSLMYYIIPICVPNDTIPIDSL